MMIAFAKLQLDDRPRDWPLGCSIAQCPYSVHFTGIVNIDQKEPSASPGTGSSQVSHRM